MILRIGAVLRLAVLLLFGSIAKAAIENTGKANKDTSEVMDDSYNYALRNASRRRTKSDKAKTTSQSNTRPPTFGPTTNEPTFGPTTRPTVGPTDGPTFLPSTWPSQTSNRPSVSLQPSQSPTESLRPSSRPSTSSIPSGMPTQSKQPSIEPTISQVPSQLPTFSHQPSFEPTTSTKPSQLPTESRQPTNLPTAPPTFRPTIQPSQVPSVAPSLSPFDVLLSLQDTPGTCINERDTGCSNDIGTVGNPNEFANCFDITTFGGRSPFFVDSVTLWVGDTRSPLPTTDLVVRLWNGTTTSGPLFDEIVYEQTLPSASNIVAGKNEISLNQAVQVFTNQICIGVSALDPDDSLRLQTEVGTGTQSYELAPLCGASSFVSLYAGFDSQLDWCIEARAFGS